MKYRFDKKIVIGIGAVFGLFLALRLFRFEQFLGFGHDEDLAGWIIKDIFIDHHLRLIGQETSIDGVFIGPIFYYLQGIFFALFGMDPIGGFWLTIVLSIITFWSIYFVFSRCFGIKAALIGLMLYTLSVGIIGFERWVVPTQPTLLWSVWFLYALIRISEGRRGAVIILGILIGLIWHVHVALVALLPLVLVVGYFGNKGKIRKLISSKEILLGCVVALVLISPFVIFEMRHGYSQSMSVLQAAVTDRNQVTGIFRLMKIYDGISQSAVNVFYEPKEIASGLRGPMQGLAIGVMFIGVFVVIKKMKTVGLIIGGWLVLIILSQFISKRAISEYYFANLIVPWIAIVSIVLQQFWGVRLFRYMTICGMLMVFYLNTTTLLNRPADQEGYLVRKEIIEQIKLDAKLNNYPCVAISYITSPGKNAGYRYFLWWADLKLVSPGNDVAVYNIVNPAGYSKEVSIQRGSVGLILPKNPVIDTAACQNSERKLLELWGFTK